MARIHIFGWTIAAVLLALLLLVWRADPPIQTVQAEPQGAAPALAQPAAPAQAEPADTQARFQTSGKLTLLRVHNVGTGYGPDSDKIDVEVVIWLDTKPGQAFGFTLRDDTNRVAHQAMLDLLRDAFNNDYRITIEYDIDEGRNNGVIVRTWLSK